RGATLATNIAHRALAEGASTGGIGSLREYDTMRRREFLGKWMVERLIRQFVTHRSWMNRAARNLGQHPDLAATLVRVTGDVAPERAPRRAAHHLPPYHRRHARYVRRVATGAAGRCRAREHLSPVAAGLAGDLRTGRAADRHVHRGQHRRENPALHPRPRGE